MSDYGYVPTAPDYFPTDPETKAFLGGVLGIEVNDELQPISDQGIVDLTFVDVNAAQSAQAAAQSASDAEDAKDLAVSAKDTAVQAKDDAVDAKDDAVQAKEDAETAQGIAEGARDAALGYMLESSKWATGQISGQDVPSTDPTYHNNSKYYSEQAASSATAADGSAEDAEAYAVGKRDGVDVTSGDPAYENNAKYYATEAANSASAAAASAATLVLDATLTQATQAAQAKAVGDALTDLNTTLSLNVIGWPYEKYYIVNNTGTVNLTPQSSNNWECAIVDCSPGDSFTITAYGGSTTRAWAFIDTNNEVIECCPVYNAWITGEIITAPANAVKLILNNRRAVERKPKCYYGKSIPAYADSLNDAVNEILESESGHVLRPILYGSDGYLYNGSNTATEDASSKSGFIFEGFSRVTDTESASTFGVVKEIKKPNRPEKLTTLGSKVKISLFVELASGVTSATARKIIFSTDGTWGASSDRITAEYVDLKNGWNLAELECELATGSTDTVYSYLILICSTLAEAQKIKNAFVFYTGSATPANVYTKDETYTKAEVDDLINYGGQFDYDLICWGDSLTAGTGGNGTNYPAVLANELGITSYKNNGVGGESANTIAGRQGGNALIIPAGNINGTIPMANMTDVFGGVINPIRGGSPDHGGNKIIINGEVCDVSITQTTSTSPDAVYTISGYTGGASAVPLFGQFIGGTVKGKIVVIFVGQNGSTVGADTSVTARITIIDSMISHIGHNRYVVCGLSSGNDSSRNADDAAMLAHYGSKFFPTRRMLVDYGLALNGLTPTEQDTTDITAGKVPESLRATDDNTHLNEYGYTALGKFLANKIMSLGYIET